MTRLTSSLATVLVFAFVGICGNGACDDEPRGRSACSMGPPHVHDSEFPMETNLEHDVLPECVPRCDAKVYHHHNISAVPSGACTVEGERCMMALRKGCLVAPESYVQGAVHGLECRCRAREWHCVITVPGSGGCGPEPTFTDGGVDTSAGGLPDASTPD